MKAWWRWMAAIAAWWLVVFLSQRALFLAFAARRLDHAGPLDLLQCQWKGLPLDVSMIGYLLLSTWLLSVLLLFRETPVLRRLLLPWHLLLLFLAALVSTADIGLFDAWGAKVDRKALGYLTFPEEAASSIRTGWLLLLIAVALAQVLCGGWLLRRIDHGRSFHQGPLTARIVSALLLPGIGFLLARGGPQDDPINKSWAWHSPHAALNLGALNSLWNLLEITVEPARVEVNPYTVMPAGEAAAQVERMRVRTPQRHRSILRVERPNILLVLLESWTADVIAPTSGDSLTTPRFTQLCGDGLLLPNHYATGFRTEQGLCAILSGFPAQPTTTIMREFGKFDRLPSLVRELDSAGYRSTYWYSGDLDFANTRAYLSSMGFDRLLDERSVPARRRTRWGAFDEELFAFHLREAGADARPFFHVLMTATSHEPFEAPVRRVFQSEREPFRYRNTVHYTDSCLGAFIDSARTRSWWDSTLVVIVADHGHHLPRYRPMYSAARHRVPCLFTGGALRAELRGTRDPVTGCHVDLPVTLLAQLGIRTWTAPWGNDLFDSGAPHRAFWTFNEGIGIADSVQTVVHDPIGDQLMEVADSARNADRDRLRIEAQLRLQVLMDQFIGFNQ
jgi:phosphoglycerol transferase MdoB-like AlkP superfamily enzyme